MISLFRGYNVCLCPSRRRQFFQGAKVPYHRRYTAFQFMTWTYIRWCSGFTNSPHGINFTSVGKQVPCDASRGPRFQEAEKFPAKVWWCSGASCTLRKSREARQLQGWSLEKFEVFKWERNTFSLTYRAKFPQIWSPAGKLTTRDVIFQLSFVQPSLKPVKAGTFSFFQFKNLIVAQYSCKGNNTHVSVSIEFPGYGVKCILFVGDVLFSSTQLRTLIYDHQIFSNAEKSW